MKPAVRVLMALVWVLVGCAGAAAAGAPAALAAGGAGGGGGTHDMEDWVLYFNEEFDGPELNTRVWYPYHSTYGHTSNQLQCYTPGNVWVKNGYLHIQARRERYRCPSGVDRDREFTSGFLGTRENGVYFPRFARYEIRAAVPHGSAFWPAFWLRHRDSSSVVEIDVMEYMPALRPGRSQSVLHYSGTKNVARAFADFEPPSLTGSSFHTWAVEIEPGEAEKEVCFRFFVDGKELAFSTPASHPQGKPFCFIDREGAFDRYPGEGLFDIAINLALGGRAAVHPDGPIDKVMDGRDAHPDALPPALPAEYVVDYVRVWVRPERR